MKNKKGKYIPFEYRATLIEGLHGKPAVCVIGRDVSERKISESLAKESDEKYRLLFSEMKSGFALHEIICDKKGRPCDYKFLEINTAFEKLTGLKREDILEKTVLSVIPNLESKWIENYGKVALTGKPIIFENYTASLDRYYEVTAYSPKKGQFATIFMDITAHRRTKEILQYRLKTEELLSDISGEFVGKPHDEIDEGINTTLEKITRFAGATRSSLFMFSEDISTISNTHEWCAHKADSQIDQLQNISVDLFGWHTRHLLKDKIVKIESMEDYPLEAANEIEWVKKHGFKPLLFIPLFRNKKIQAAIGIYAGKDKKTEWNDALINLLKVAGYTYLNALDRKKSEETITDSEIRFRSIIENSQAGYFFINKDGIIENVNDTWIKLYKYSSREEVIGKHFVEIQKLEDINQTKMFVTGIMKGNKQYMTGEFSRKCKDNSIGYHTFSAWPLINGGRATGFEGFIIDSTERKRIESALMESEERFRLMMHHSPFVIELYALDGLQIEVNHAYEVLWSFPASTTVNKFNVLKSKEVEDTGLMVYVKKAYAGEAVVVPEYKFDPTGATEAKGKGRVRWLSTRIYPLKGEDNKVKNIVITHEDITERKKIELNLKDSLEEKETLLKEVHHRVKNNLQVISSLLHLQSAFITDKKALELFKESEERIHSIALLHNKLYQSENIARVDFSGYIEELVKSIFKAYMPKGITISRNVLVDDMDIGIDLAIPCGLMITELVTNSLKHAFSGRQTGIIEVKVSKNGDNTATLSVSDDGTGIPEDVDPYNSNSLGLQLVAMLVKQLNATFESVKEKNTLFVIKFNMSQPHNTAK